MYSFLSRLAARPTATVLALGLALLLSGNWILPLIDRDEPRFAEAAREMRQRGDWVIPWLNGDYRFDKPPLIYWCQAACYRLLGESAGAARLPSALFGVATAWVLLLWGRSSGRELAGFHAALMWLTCLQVLIHGRLALADMAMVFFVTVAYWAGWEMTRPEAVHRWRWGGLFVLSLALGFLAKGPVSWLPVGGLALGRWLRPQAFRVSWSALAACLPASLLLVGLWGVPALIATHGEFYRVGIGRHVIERSFDVMEGHGGRGWLGYLLTVPLYLLTFFPSFFPWALAVPAALRHWWAARQGDPHGWFLLVQAALVFTVFGFVRTKLPHYTLPAFPCIALWLGSETSGRPEFARRLAQGVLGMAALTWLITLGVFSAARSHLIAPNLWREVSPHARPGMELAAVGFDEPSLIWEFRRGITNYVEFIPAAKAESFLARPGPRVLIVPTQQALGPLLAAAPGGVRVHAVGYDTVHFERHDLTAIIKP